MKMLVSLLSLSFLLVGCNESYTLKTGSQVGTTGGGGSNGGGGGGTSITCPSDYLKIPFNTSVGTLKDFCVAKYEMKNVSGAAVSQVADLPWSNITATDALAACQAIGPGYDLISNAEWMTIARNVENVNVNWSNNTIGSGQMSIGNYYFCDATEEYAHWSCGPDSPSFTYKRTFPLSTGDVLWDFAGNAREWVDWEIETPTNTFTVAQTVGCPSGYQEVNQVPVLCPAILPNSKVGSTDTGLDSSHGIGSVNMGWSTGGTGGTSGGGGGPGATQRSGGGSGGLGGGAFAADFSSDPSWGDNFVGFRCVYRGQ